MRATSASLTVPPKRSKYGNKRVKIDGHTFASKAEGKRYAELKLLLSAGKIEALQLQPRFPMVVGGERICTYVADFTYWERSTYWERRMPDEKGRIPLTRRVVEDVKSSATKTPLYQVKKKLLKALYRLEVTEIVK